MLVIINALKSISRSKGRNILIGIIVLVIAASSCVALAIRNAANEAEAAAAQLVDITGTIIVNNEKMMEEMQSTSKNGVPDRNEMRNMAAKYQGLTLSEFESYADSENLDSYYYSESISLDATGELEAYGSEEDSGSSNDRIIGGGGGGFAIAGNRMVLGDFTVTGFSSKRAMTNFWDGDAGILDGEMFNLDLADMSCIISNELALFNGLSLGDTITLANPSSEEDKDGNAIETYTFTISGIYTVNSTDETEGPMQISTSQLPANQIYVSSGSLQNIVKNSEASAVTGKDDNGVETTTAIPARLSFTYVFSDIEGYENFETELTQKGLSENYLLTSQDINNYEASLTPLKSLSKNAATMLILILAIGAVVLIVINLFNIRERKYEVGVLTAIGIKKRKVAMQFVTELLCVTMLAIFIGAGIGAAVSIPVSQELLSEQIEQMQTLQNSQESRFSGPRASIGGPADQGRNGPKQIIGGGGMMNIISGNSSDVNYLEQINAAVNLSVLGQMIAIGIILTFVSCLAAVVFVMRYEPLKILANRS